MGSTAQLARLPGGPCGPPSGGGGGATGANQRGVSSRGGWGATPTHRDQISTGLRLQGGLVESGARLRPGRLRQLRLQPIAFVGPLVS